MPVHVEKHLICKQYEKLTSYHIHNVCYILKWTINSCCFWWCTFHCPWKLIEVEVQSAQCIEVLTHLVEAKEAQLSHNVQGADPRACGDLSSHLQANLYNLQRIGENHLGSSGLRKGNDRGEVCVPLLTVGIPAIKWGSDECTSGEDGNVMCKHFTRSTIDTFFPGVVRKWPWQEEEKAGIDRGTTEVRLEQASGEPRPWLMVGRFWPWHRPSAPALPPWGTSCGAQPGFTPHTSPIHDHSQGSALNHPGGSGSRRATPPRHGTLWLGRIYHPPRSNQAPGWLLVTLRGRGLICKHPSKGLKKAPARSVIFRVEGEYPLLWRLMHASTLFYLLLFGGDDPTGHSNQINQTFDFHKKHSERILASEWITWGETGQTTDGMDPSPIPCTLFGDLYCSESVSL